MAEGDVIGQTLQEVASASIWTDRPLKEHFAAVKAHRPYRNVRFTRTDRNGRIRHFRASGVPILDDEGTFLGYRGVLADDTEATEARIRAERAEAYLRTAFEMVPHALVIYDGSERLVLCNSSYQKMYSLPDELVEPGGSFEEAIRFGLAQGIYPNAVGQEEDWLAERLRRHRQTSEPFEQRVGEKFILVNENKMPDGSCVGTRTDVTEVKRASERHLQGERMRALGTLAAGVAHDFNNMLSAMIGYLELAHDDVERGLDPRPDLGKALLAGGRARDLIKQILRFGRKAEDGVAERCHVAELVRDTADLLKPTLHPDVSLEVNLLAPGAELTAVPGHITQIAMNLAVNAAQAIGDGKGRIEILVDEIAVDPRFAERHPPLTAGRCVMLCVRDDGPGMTLQVRQRIFDPFFTTKQVGQGSGMGLAVVHGLASRYGGAVTVESKPGAGAEFRVYLPCLPRPAPEPAVSAAAEADETATPLPALSASDSPPLDSKVKAVLSSLGYQTVCARDLDAACSLLERHPVGYSFIFSGVHLSATDGAAFTDRIRQIAPDLPILLLADGADLPGTSTALERGKVAVVSEPLGVAELAAALASLDLL